MSRYQKYREKYLEIQKRYDDKNREKKRLYDKKRWEKRKKEHQALLDIGAKAGDNLTAQDMKAKSSAEGSVVEGDKLEAVVTWEGQDEEIPFEDIIKASDERKMDLRFGGNLGSAKTNNTGCVLCLDSCATGITSDAAYPTGTSQGNEVQWFGDDSVLPADGTKVVVTFRLAK